MRTVRVNDVNFLIDFSIQLPFPNGVCSSLSYTVVSWPSSLVISYKVKFSKYRKAIH